MIGLVNHVTMTAGHSAAVIMQYAGAGLEIFFRAGKQGLGGIGLIRFRPENNYVGEHGRNDMGGQTTLAIFLISGACGLGGGVYDCPTYQVLMRKRSIYG